MNSRDEFLAMFDRRVEHQKRAVENFSEPMEALSRGVEYRETGRVLDPSDTGVTNFEPIAETP